MLRHLLRHLRSARSFSFVFVRSAVYIRIRIPRLDSTWDLGHDPGLGSARPGSGSGSGETAVITASASGVWCPVSCLVSSLAHSIVGTGLLWLPNPNTDAI